MTICKACKAELGMTYNCEHCNNFNKEQARKKINDAITQMEWHGGVALIEDLVDQLSKQEKVKTVTDFVHRYMVNNGDNFYTPYANTFDTHEKAVEDYNGKLNQNRGEGKVWVGPGQDDYGPDSTCCGEDECEHPTHEAPHPQMMSYLELPYGRICPHCGGSMVAIIQLDKNGSILKTLLIDCG